MATLVGKYNASVNVGGSAHAIINTNSRDINLNIETFTIVYFN